MRPLRFLRLIALAAAVASAQTGAGVQNQIFTVPAGWTRTDAGPSVILTPESPDKNLVTLFLGGRPLSGVSFRAAFEQDVQALGRGLRVVGAGQIESRTANGVELLAVTAELRNPQGIPSYRYYLAAGPPGRIEMMVYSAASPELFRRYWPGVSTFISGWSFSNVAGAPAAPPASTPPAAPASAAIPSSPPRAGRFDAIYSALKVQSVYRYGVVVDTYTFFADGTVCHCLPTNGLAGFDIAAEKRMSPEFVGDYQVEGDRITMTLARGTYRRTGVLAGDRIMLEGRPYELRADPGKLGPHPLDGVFVRADASSPDVARRAIRFTRDGRFQDQGIVESVATTQIINGNPLPDRPGGAGAYNISRYTLTLRYSDGYVRQLPVTVEPADLDKPRLTSSSVNTYILIAR